MNVAAERAACEILLIACAWVFVPLVGAAWLTDRRRERRAACNEVRRHAA